MGKKNSGLTRQGVRDLSGIKSKPRGVRMEAPPAEAISCNHKIVTNADGSQSCRKCFAMDEELFEVPRY